MDTEIKAEELTIEADTEKEDKLSEEVTESTVNKWIYILHSERPKSGLVRISDSQLASEIRTG